MNLHLTNEVINGVCSVAGPQVSFMLADSGTANVMIHVALSDGTHMNFPDGTGPVMTRSTVLPPGEYICTVLVAAFSHGDFGQSYRSSVVVAGKRVVVAEGQLPDGQTEEDDNQSFVLRVA